MAVVSSSFGSVTLTGEDAKKFRRQVLFGKPKKGAKDGLRRGVKLASDFRDGNREIAFKVELKGR